jgi:oligoribonuclease
MEAELTNSLVWIDLEMSGLEPDRHVILEIATIVTSSDLVILAEGPNIAIHHGRESLTTMEEWSKTHHEASGLLERVRISPHNSVSAEAMTLEFLQKYTEAGKSPVCGNSVWQDRRFLSKYMPALNAFFHYRNIDVSTVKELANRWYPSLAKPKKRKDHLALNDIKESIAELRYYREKVFRRPWKS